MKSSLLILSCFLLSAAAHADPQTKRATFAQMESDVKDFNQVLGGIEGCDFRIEPMAAGGMRLTMKDSAKGTVTVEVNPASEITLDSGDEREDGSFSKSYKISGAGELDVVHAQDAFDHAFLTGADGRTVSCEIDF
jgi:hypothetical protein